MQTHTLLTLEGNSFYVMPEIGGPFTEDEARDKAKLLTDEMRQQVRGTAARVIAVRTLESINRNTQAAELTNRDLRWLAGEVVDRCDFFLAAPEWARKAIDGVAARNSFDEKYVAHVLAAIRCCLSVEQKMQRQVNQDEAKRANGRKF